MSYWKQPKDDSVFSWTRHAIFKMRQYGLSATKVRNVVRRPKRTEEGVLEGAVAVMQPTGTPKNPSEVWVMYVPVLVKKRRRIKIITAWRYPGISKRRGPVPIPPDILQEVAQLLGSV